MSIRPIIPCEVPGRIREIIDKYTADLIKAAPTIGAHGLTEQEFSEAGILRGAIERLRGTQAATTSGKKEFVDQILAKLHKSGRITDYTFQGGGERHDYIVHMPGDYVVIIETKGCLDGNNTNIFERPPQADEFIVWSLCQNPTADPQHNAWSGLQTRLSAELIHKKQLIDAVIIWDMVCNGITRPCPKLTANPQRATRLASTVHVPPPCIYLLPHSVPDPRNNPKPRCQELREVRFAHALWQEFKGDENDLVQVHIEARVRDSAIERRCTFIRNGVELAVSRWAEIKRARQ